MRRRHFLTTGVGLTTVLAGCLGNPLDGDETSDPTTSSSTQTTTEPPTSTATDTSRLPTEEDIPTASREFTPNGSTTPLSKNKFLDTHEEILRSDDREIRTAWYTNVLPSGNVSITYVADEENQDKRMKIFVDTYLKLTRRTGGTNRDAHYEVQQSGGNVWYTWELTDKLARKYLSGKISKKKLMKNVQETVEQ